mgnify:CR=1 FL=1
MDIIEEFDVATEVDRYKEYSESQAFDVFIDELAILHCGDVY